MGGLIAGTAVILLYCLAAKKHPGIILDAFAVPASAGIVILKFGCFFNGCCFGKPTDGPLGMIFPANELRYKYLESLPLITPASPRVHPTQLYEICGALLAIALAVLLEKRLRMPAGSRACLFSAGLAVFQRV